MGFYKDSHIKTGDMPPHDHDFFMPNKENNLKGSLFKNQKFSRLRSRPVSNRVSPLHLRSTNTKESEIMCSFFPRASSKSF